MPILTTKGVYGLMAIAQIANASKFAPISIKDISDKTGVSKGYLEQILNDLRNAKIISSKKGKNGGYFLRKPAQKISFYDIFHTLEKDFKMTNLDVKDEILQQFFKNGDKKLEEVFSSSISDIIKTTEDSSKNLDFAI
ncbi:RrF2 family transcriptional regulator [Campylobacter ureolyticus]|uniref:Rrf2 family transcriptional regulator n=1 Tax=Campylobacter ureolyticus TaxID=827 RepID=A0A9Q4KQC9_9BACT|nr:Rrf2 family transcriptional regulator [Campylobacter ureolyticus]MCZ6103931.1 Rrf2 family transcriptional regulator [Campylobacter ureolyticus]MCZ6162252.1 Rrf2 family transcriptional regulator [Campylobacter ureolyticus]MCZ6171126.1 Rrf2 family transcriptional regulator [Campylobacter ureolyticus]MDU4982352.1 Rrf2 family transcriptional regulator [Campylobacter ureolyticus]